MSNSSRLRIGVVSIDSAWATGSWSGIPYQVLSHLQQEDVDIEVFSPLDRKLKLLLIPSILLARTQGQRLVLNHSALLARSWARQIRARLRKAPVDVLLSINSIPITMLDCSQPIVAYNDSIFHDIVNYYPGFFSSLTPRAIKLGKLQEERALSRMHAAVYSSEWAAAGARRLTDPRKVHVVPFGSSLPVDETIDEVVNRARAKRRIEGKVCELLFIGVEWERKGGDLAIETARLLNETGLPTRLRVVGSRPPYDPPSFVDLLGTISKSTPEGIQQIIELYKTSDVFLLPTKAEAAGIVFCEASSYGLPIVTHDTGGIPDYVRAGVNGVRLPVGATAANFAAAVREVLQPPTYQTLATGAFNDHLHRLNWRSSVQQLLAICQSSAEDCQRRTRTSKVSHFSGTQRAF